MYSSLYENKKRAAPSAPESRPKFRPPEPYPPYYRLFTIPSEFTVFNHRPNSPLHLSYFSYYFGTGNSNGVPPDCPREPGWSHNPFPFPQPFPPAHLRSLTISGVFTSLHSSHYRLPQYVYSLYNSTSPHPQPTSPDASFAALSAALHSLQCTLSTILSGGVVVKNQRAAVWEEYEYGLQEMHANLQLLSALCLQAGEVDYAKVLLEDCGTLLELMGSGEATGGMSARDLQDGKMYTYMRLGNVKAMQNDMKAANEYYEQGAAIREDDVPVHLLNFVAASHLALGNIDSFVAAADRSQAVFLSNVQSISKALHVPFTPSSYFPLQVPGDAPVEVFMLPDAHALATVAGPCIQMIRHHLSYAAGELPLQSLAVHAASKYACVHTTSAVSTGSLAAADHFRLGKALRKRGYEEEARHHLSLAASPYEKQGEVHEVYLRLSLPLVFESLKERALIVSAFEHEVATMLAKAQRVKGCDSLHNFDVLPLVRFAADFAAEDADDDNDMFEEAGLVGGGTDGAAAGAADLYVMVSKLFYKMCPSLLHHDESAKRRWDAASRALSVVSQRSPPPKLAKPVKIRVGVIAGKLANHEVLKVHGALLSYLASRSGDGNSQLEVVFGCFPHATDAATRRLTRSLSLDAANSLNLVNPSVNATASVDKIKAREFDVLLYLDLPTDARTFALAHRRLAPVQIGVWGHHSYSSGIGDSVDYIVVPSAFFFAGGAAPSRQGQGTAVGLAGKKSSRGVAAAALPTSQGGQYSEQVVLVPGLMSGTPYGGSPQGTLGEYKMSPLFVSAKEFSRSFMLPSTANVYVVPATAGHFHPAFDSIIKRILQADEDAYILIGVRPLTSGESAGMEHPLFETDLQQHGLPTVWGQLLRNRMRRRIGGGKTGGSLWRRVRVLASALSTVDYAAVLATAKVALDTFPFGNVVPGMESVFVGTPVVTCSRKMRGGGGGQMAAVYEVMNEGGGGGGDDDDDERIELDAFDDDAYVELAVKLAKDESYRSDVEDKIDRRKYRVFGSGEESGYGTKNDPYLTAVEEFIVSVGKGVAEEREKALSATSET